MRLTLTDVVVYPMIYYGCFKNMGVEPKIGGKPPKWMVKIMENPIEMDDLGGPPLFLETPTSQSQLINTLH